MADPPPSYHPVAAMDGGATKKGAGATMTTESAAQHGKSGLWARVTDHLPFLRTKRGIAVTVVAILVIVGGGLAGLAALRNRNKSGGSGDGGSTGGVGNPTAITDDAYFYGLSPPVYPSRKRLPRCSCVLPGLSKWLIFIA